MTKKMRKELINVIAEFLKQEYLNNYGDANTNEIWVARDILLKYYKGTDNEKILIEAEEKGYYGDVAFRLFDNMRRREDL